MRGRLVCVLAGGGGAIATIIILCVFLFSNHNDISAFVAKIEQQSNSRHKLRIARRAVETIGTDSIYEYIVSKDIIDDADRYLIVASYLAGDEEFSDLTLQIAREGFILARGAVGWGDREDN